MKKILNTMLVLALLVLVPTFVVNAVSGTNDNSGSIEITDAIEGKTYSAYQILKLESYDTAKEAYTYKIADGWANFFATGGAGAEYVNIDDQGYVTWNANKKTENDMKTFAQLALVYAKANSGITAISPTEVNGTTVRFTGLNLGYYLVDSSVGAICSLTTTKPNATAEEKNSVPTVVKEVKENSNGAWGEKNNASIGQTVEYKTTITASDGAENYVLYDNMSEGLTYSGVTSVKLIKNGAAESTATVVDASYYTVSTADTNYTFTVTFAKEFTDTLVAGDKIVVEYTAVLNEKAVIAGNGNPNDTWLEYGDKTEDNKTPEDTTITYTYSFDLVKTDSSNNTLTGAKFRLYDSLTGGNEIEVVWDATKNAYRVAKTNETGVEIEVTTEKLVEGKIVIIGLDAGTYYLEETKAPEGYNKLASRVKFEIVDSNLGATITETTDSETGKVTITVTGGVHVINYTGDELPTTGGMGTVLFIVIGSLMVTLFGVLLVTKLRISKMSA